LLVVVLLLLLWAPAAEAWTWPVRGPVVEGFSFDKQHPYAAGQRRGIDIGSSGGVPVLAPASGTVTFAGSVPGKGMCVTIATADGLAVTLAHLGSVSVEKGAAVGEGATIGTVGTGATSEVGGTYVHLGIRVASDPNGYLDPLSLLPPATTVGSQSSTPAPNPAPVAQQPVAGSAPQTVADSSTTTISSGAPPLVASGASATATSAPVEVPATDFARHVVPASSKIPSSPVMRLVPRTSVAAVAAVPPERRARAVLAGTRGRVPLQRVGYAPRSATVTATPSVRRSGRTLDAIDRADPVPAPHAGRAWSTPIASRSTPSAAPHRRRSQTALVGGALLALLLVLEALFHRRRGAPIAQPHEETVVVALPLPLRWDPVREEQRRAA
jgi:hypothetical protein